ncbi:hypothetical protein [Actinomadura sp. B10D3]|uniref:hypothetical protein n=1 Tax=Actinomadura sp. B10D3 TaxID=3153557 RepID=UPI00325E74D0
MIGNLPQDRDKLLVTGISPATEPPAAPDREPDAETAPVFTDASGWRARFGRRIGLLAGAVLIVFLGSLGLGMTTGADVPLTPWSRTSPEPRAKLSRPSVPPKSTASRPPAAARPRPPAQAARPAPSATPRPPSVTPSPTAAATTDRPGKSQASPPAWGRRKKNR